MKLHELGARRPTEQATMVIENQSGRRLNFAAIGPRRAQGMLHQVQRLLREHRTGIDHHGSERDSAYLQLVVMEQALKARVAEVNEPMVVDVNDPKTKAAMQKAERGQMLTPDEQNTMTAIALTKKESQHKPARMVREQSEIQQAQVVLAAQDMIDRVQGMLEDISEMQFKDLPALADSIKNDMGVEQSTQFQSAASAAFTSLLQAVQAGRTEMESAQGVLTGQAPQVPGMEPGADQDMTPAMPGPGEEDLDLSLDANLEPDEAEPETGTASLGRERR